MWQQGAATPAAARPPSPTLSSALASGRRSSSLVQRASWREAEAVSASSFFRARSKHTVRGCDRDQSGWMCGRADESCQTALAVTVGMPAIFNNDGCRPPRRASVALRLRAAGKRGRGSWLGVRELALGCWAARAHLPCFRAGARRQQRCVAGRRAWAVDRGACIRNALEEGCA